MRCGDCVDDGWVNYVRQCDMNRCVRAVVSLVQVSVFHIEIVAVVVVVVVVVA